MDSTNPIMMVYSSLSEFPQPKFSDPPSPQPMASSSAPAPSPSGPNLTRDSVSGTMLSEIIKSKRKLFATFNKVNDLSCAEHSSAPIGIKAVDGFGILTLKSKEVDAAAVSHNVATTAITDATSGDHLPAVFSHNVATSAVKQVASRVHLPDVANHNVATGAIPQAASGEYLPAAESAIPQAAPGVLLLIQEQPSQNLPMTFVPPVSGQPINACPTCAKKRRKNKKKSNKKLCIDDR